MATKALTPVARRASRDYVSARQAFGREQDWRQILASQNATLIWHNLSILARAVATEDQSECDNLTQELFLHLLAAGRFQEYVEKNYSNEEIESDLLAVLNR
jgi:hypothetical protein